MSVYYGIAFAASLVLTVICIIKHKGKNLELIGLFAAMLITNFGYFFLSISHGKETALLFNTISYLGSVFLPYFMLRIVVKLNDVKICPRLNAVLISASAVVFIIAASPPFSGVYYKSYDIDKINNATVLVKTYGPLHNLYKIFIVAYLLAIVCFLIYTFTKKADKKIKISAFLTLIMAINIFFWIGESIAHSRFEYMSYSYVVTQLLLLLFYEIINDLYFQSQLEKIVPEIEKLGFTKAQAQTIIDRLEDSAKLTNREKQVAALLIEGKKRKEIADTLFVTESTIKKHSSSVYKKLNVENRKELLEKVKTLENIKTE